MYKDITIQFLQHFTTLHNVYMEHYINIISCIQQNDIIISNNTDDNDENVMTQFRKYLFEILEQQNLINLNNTDHDIFFDRKMNQRLKYISENRLGMQNALELSIENESQIENLNEIPEHDQYIALKNLKELYQFYKKFLVENCQVFNVIIMKCLEAIKQNEKLTLNQEIVRMLDNAVDANNNRIDELQENFDSEVEALKSVEIENPNFNIIHKSDGTEFHGHSIERDGQNINVFYMYDIVSNTDALHEFKKYVK